MSFDAKKSSLGRGITVLPVASNIPGEPVVDPYPPRPEKFKDIKVKPIEGGPQPPDLPPA